MFICCVEGLSLTSVVTCFISDMNNVEIVSCHHTVKIAWDM